MLEAAKAMKWWEALPAEERERRERISERRMANRAREKAEKDGGQQARQALTEARRKNIAKAGQIQQAMVRKSWESLPADVRKAREGRSKLRRARYEGREGESRAGKGQDRERLGELAGGNGSKTEKSQSSTE